MKFRNIAFGVAIGVISGVGIALLNNRNDERVTGEDNVIKEIKAEINNVKTNLMTTTKNTPETFKTLTGEVKDLITNFQADITSNIDNIKENVDNLSNRGESISKHLEENPIENPFKFGGKKK